MSHNYFGLAHSLPKHCSESAARFRGCPAICCQTDCKDELHRSRLCCRTRSASKRRECPVKDAEGRHVVQGNFVPFVMSNMGSLDSEAHKFLRKLRKKDSKRTEHLMDVLVVQHAKWIARRLRRSLGFYNQPVGQRPAQQKQQFSPAKNPLRGRLQKLHAGLRAPPSDAAAASSQSGRAGKAAARATKGSVGC